MKNHETPHRLKNLLKWFLRKKIVKIFCWSAVTFLTLLVLFYQIENWRGTRAWESAQKDYLEAGGTLDIHQIFLSPVPEEDNFGALSVFKDIEVEDSKIGQKNRDRIKTASLKPPSSTTGKRPKLNRDTALDEYLSLYARHLGIANEEQSPTECAQVLLALIEQQAGDLLNEMKEGIDFPHAQFKILNRFPEDHQLFYDFTFPHISSILHLSRILNLQGLASIKMGDRKSAREATALCLQLRNLIINDLLIGFLVAQSLDTMTLDLIHCGIENDIWTDEDLHWMAQASRATLFSEALPKAIQTEALVVSEMFDIMKNQRDKRALLNPVTAGSDQKTASQLQHWLTPQGWFSLNGAEILRTYLPLISIKTSSDNLDDLIQFTESKQKELEASNDSFSPSTYMASAVIPPVLHAFNRIISVEIRRQLMIISCAIERFRIAHERLPNKLSELVPDYLPVIPKDPIGHSPLRYQVQGKDGYQLYSIGLDQIDNNGTPPPKGQRHKSEQTDVVWKIR